jgi:hypothetical protein
MVPLDSKNVEGKRAGLYSSKARPHTIDTAGCNYSNLDAVKRLASNGCY